jgi:hypothetical protein
MLALLALVDLTPPTPLSFQARGEQVSKEVLTEVSSV